MSDPPLPLLWLLPVVRIKAANGPTLDDLRSRQGIIPPRGRSSLPGPQGRAQRDCRERVRLDDRGFDSFWHRLVH